MKIVHVAAGVCLLAGPAWAQNDDSFDVGEKPVGVAAAPPSNWIAVGGQYNSGRSYYLDRFKGSIDPGFYGLGDFHVGGRDAWDSGGTQYWSVDGEDMGFDSRSATAKAGQQGSWGLTLSYDGIPYEATNEFKSVWRPSGATVPGVAPGSLPTNLWPSRAQYPAFTASNTPHVQNGFVLPSIWLPKTSPSLSADLYDYNISTLREVFSGSGKYQWNDWTIIGSIRHEHKTGYQANSLEIGGTVGLTASSPTTGTKTALPAAGLTSGLGYFAQPIDYDTDRYDLTATYSAPRLQVQVGYMFSNFKDNLSEFNASNPWALGALTTNFTGTGATRTDITAPYSLPPSNSAQQVRALVGYNLSPTTRVNANFAYGLQMQNDPYLGGTGVPGVNPTQPRSSFDGLVQTFYGNAAVVTQPSPKLTMRMAYTIDDRDNQSPRNGYIDDTRSTAAVGDDCGYADGRCYNLPFSYEHQSISAEASYRLLPQTKFILNDTFETTYRSYANTSLVTGNTTSAKIRSQLDDDIFASLGYSHQERVAHNYTNGNTWYLLTNNGVGGDNAGFLMYSEASRKRDQVKATVDLSPAPKIDTTIMFNVSSDSYPDTTYGLRSNVNFQVGPDVSWDISSKWNAHAYYTYQQVISQQASVYSSAGTGTGPTGTGYSVPWTNKTNDAVHTLGATLNWQAVPDVLKMVLSYNFSYGDTAYVLGDGMAVIGGAQTSQTTLANLTLQQLPDITSMLSILAVRGEYTFRPNWTVIFGYEYERFTYKDYMNNVGATQYANAVFPGTLNPNEAVHVFGAGLRVRF